MSFTNQSPWHHPVGVLWLVDVSSSNIALFVLHNTAIVTTVQLYLAGTHTHQCMVYTAGLSCTVHSRLPLPISRVYRSIIASEDDYTFLHISAADTPNLLLLGLNSKSCFKCMWLHAVLQLTHFASWVILPSDSQHTHKVTSWLSIHCSVSPVTGFTRHTTNVALNC